MNKKVIIFVLLCLVSVLVGPSFLSLAHNDQKKWWPWGIGKFSKRVAGTYLLDLGPPEGFENEERPFHRLVTLMVDGNWLSTDAHSNWETFAFTDQHGAWKRTEYREVKATVLDFEYEIFSGIPMGVSRISFVMKFSKDFQTVTGKFSGKLFLHGEDPLDPNVPLEEFGAEFTGRRVHVID